MEVTENVTRKRLTETLGAGVVESVSDMELKYSERRRRRRCCGENKRINERLFTLRLPPMTLRRAFLRVVSEEKIRLQMFVDVLSSEVNLLPRQPTT